MRKSLHLPQILWCGLKAAPGRTLRGAYWYLRGKRVRGLNLLKAAAATSPDYYRLWTRVTEPRLVAQYCAADTDQPLPQLSAVVLGAAADPLASRRTRQSLTQAFGSDLPILELDRDGTFVTPPPPGTWLLAIQAGDFVAPVAGRALAAACRRNGVAGLVYWDEDRLVDGARRDPWAKGEWDELVFLARDGLCGAGAFRVPDDLAADAARDPAAMLAHAAAGADQSTAVHVPLVLTHRAAPARADQAARRAQLLSRAWPGHPGLAIGDDAGLQVEWPVEHWPSVSIVIPTRDRVELLEPCIKGLKQLEYPGEVELIVADNGSVEPATLHFLAQFRAAGGRVVDCPGEFNFSTINNRAVAAAGGELVCLLNNDIEPLDGIWLTAMARHAVRPGIGAVGAMLLYPDGTIQHAGVALGVGGAAGHIYRGLHPADPGNGAMHRTTRRVSIVTAACLLVRRSTYLSMGGLDEREFAVAFNDVDFCLRLGRAGLANVFVAEACLIHHESKSRGSDMHASNLARYRRELAALHARWDTAVALDPWHSALIRRASEDYVLEL
ncbi:glycosyltransferase family 2 protein [Novosphingobium sp.]|uniref:glycosyltransferase family 2 protein n=1 Tax=Novosphingobium sp. TaxID=1874826 RepID=UPI0035B08EA2